MGYAAERETTEFQSDVDEARVARVEQVVSRLYSPRLGWTGLQPTLEQVSALYRWRILVRDSQGRIMADSHPKFDLPGKGGTASRARTILRLAASKTPSRPWRRPRRPLSFS